MSKKVLAYLLIVITCFTVAFGFGFFKAASIEGITVFKQVVFLAIGVMLLFSNLFLFLIAYRYERISVLYPITALTYPVTFFIGILAFGEAATPFKILGTLLVVAGSYLIARKEVG